MYKALYSLGSSMLGEFVLLPNTSFRLEIRRILVASMRSDSE